MKKGFSIFSFSFISKLVIKALPSIASMNKQVFKFFEAMKMNLHLSIPEARVFPDLSPGKTVSAIIHL